MIFINMRSLTSLILVAVVTLSAQNMRVGEGGSKTLLAVPMVGSGTWEDPKRPAFVREAGVSFRYQVSDDGTMALVEAMPRNLAESAKLVELASKDARAKIFRPEIDKKADVEAEFKRLKRDFNPDTFGRLGPQVKPAPAPGGGK